MLVIAIIRDLNSGDKIAQLCEAKKSKNYYFGTIDMITEETSSAVRETKLANLCLQKRLIEALKSQLPAASQAKLLQAAWVNIFEEGFYFKNDSDHEDKLLESLGIIMRFPIEEQDLSSLVVLFHQIMEKTDPFYEWASIS